MADLTFRKAQPSDLENIFGIFSRAIENMQSIGIDQWDELYPSKADIENDIKLGQMYLAVSGVDIAAAYVLNISFDEEYKLGRWRYSENRFMVVHRLCVNPDYQNQGVALKTMLYIENELRKQGVEAIRLDAFEKNSYALRLYNRLGFETVGYAKWRKGRFLLMEKKL